MLMRGKKHNFVSNFQFLIGQSVIFVMKNLYVFYYVDMDSELK